MKLTYWIFANGSLRLLREPYFDEDGEEPILVTEQEYDWHRLFEPDTWGSPYRLLSAAERRVRSLLDPYLCARPDDLEIDSLQVVIVADDDGPGVEIDASARISEPWSEPRWGYLGPDGTPLRFGYRTREGAIARALRDDLRPPVRLIQAPRLLIRTWASHWSMPFDERWDWILSCRALPIRFEEVRA